MAAEEDIRNKSKSLMRGVRIARKGHYNINNGTPIYPYGTSGLTGYYTDKPGGNLMRQTLVSLFIISILLTACSASAATPTATSQAGSTQPAIVAPSDTPTAASSPTPAPSATPNATPTPAAIPANFGPDNFHQFVQVQTYRVSIETAVGKNIFDMRLDAIAYSPDGRYVAVGGCTGNWNDNCISDVYGGHSFLYILDARTAKIVTTLPETEVTVTGLTFSTDGEKLIYAVNPDRIVIWGVASGKIERVLWQGRGSSYRRVAINPDGSRIAEVDSNSLRVWDANSGDLLTQKPGGNFGDKLPRFSANGSRLAVFSLDSGKEITIYDTATWEKLSVISIPGDYPGAVAISQDFKLLATAESVGDVNVLLWDVATGTQVGSLKDPLWSGIDALGFTPDGQLLLVSGTSAGDDYDHSFSVWNVSARQELGMMVGPSDSFGKILFSGDGTAFMTGGSLWSLPDKNVLVAGRALTDFDTALNKGDYGTAAGSYQPYEGDVTYFKSQGVDATDLPALLEFVCTQDSQPCMSVREIVYAGKEALGNYGLLVRFTAPDGSVYVDADGFDTIWMYADMKTDGKFIFSSLPPFPRAP